MEKANKYILIKFGNLADFRCGFVFRHADLCPSHVSDQDVLGGGYFEFDDAAQTVRLYGKSDDYGYPKNLENYLKNPVIRKVVMEELGEEYYWHFSDQEREMPADYKLMITEPDGKTKVVK